MENRPIENRLCRTAKKQCPGHQPTELSRIMDASRKKNVEKLKKKLTNIQLQLRSSLVSDLLKEGLRSDEEKTRMRIIEAAGQLRLFP